MKSSLARIWLPVDELLVLEEEVLLWLAEEALPALEDAAVELDAELEALEFALALEALELPEVVLALVLGWSLLSDPPPQPDSMTASIDDATNRTYLCVADCIFSPGNYNP